MRAWLTPATLTPNVAHVRRLIIPGDVQMLANVAGALLELTYERNWEQQGGVTPLEAANAALKMYNQFLSEAWSMIGAVVPAITAATPVGCLELDGATYNASDYPLLFAVLDSFWKDDADTFHVPDLRGRFPLALSSGHGMGSTGGVETVTLNSSQMPSHSHTTGNSLAGLAVVPGEGPVLIPNLLLAFTGSAGGDGSHENMPPYMALRYVLIAE